LIQTDNEFIAFVHPNGDRETARALTSLGEDPENNKTYYQVGESTGNDIRKVFRDHVRRTV
jgi:hypothetical protein